MSVKRATSRKPAPRRALAKSSSRGDALDVYRSKRHFDVTPEPPPDRAPRGTKGEGLEFVVQKHDATRMHYDVRLEVGSAMMSWAVPKGPSYDPEVKRLAVETEDHPMEYNRFEGRIPDGEYGAGDVLIWDRGTYETVPPGQQDAMRAKGHFHVRFFGDKLEGDWHILCTARSSDGGHLGSPGAKTQWLMFKAKDAFADAGRDIVAERPESIVSGKTATRGPRRVGASPSGKSARTLLANVGEVALAVSQSRVSDPSRYLFEIKYDGYRLLAAKAGGSVVLQSRRENDWTAKFQPVASAIAALPVREAIIDGEACVVDAAGRPSFGSLQAWLGGERGAGTLAYVAFDLLWVDGRDLRKEPLEARRELLESLLANAPAPLSFSRSIDGNLDRITLALRESKLEGLVAKKKGSPYVGGRSGTWVKLKFVKRQDCAVAGYLPLSGTKNQIGALLLAVVEKGKLRYAGRVGTGFDARARKVLAERLDAAQVSRPEVLGTPNIKGAVWTTPALVCEIAFSEWTRDGCARQPSYVGLREDKVPEECTLDDSPAATPPEVGRPRARAMKPGTKAADKDPERASGAKLSNPTKVLFPRDGITKRDVVDYYTRVSGVMLPHLRGRPLALQRWPHGIDGEEWYQQNAPDKCPPFVRLLAVGDHHTNKKRIVADNVETLQWLANLAAITLHQWASHAPGTAKTERAIVKALAEPDYFVIDLDPGAGTWAHLIEVAMAVRRLIDALEFESVVKTSGKRGLHIVVPIVRGPSHAEATAFAEHMARAVAKVLPKIATVERMKAKRGGRLYVDFGQNGEGKTVVAPYTLRARDSAVVSTPIAWSEVTEKLDPTRFTIKTVLARIDKRGDLFAGALSGKNTLPPLR